VLDDTDCSSDACMPLVTGVATRSLRTSTFLRRRTERYACMVAPFAALLLLVLMHGVRVPPAGRRLEVWSDGDEIQVGEVPRR
jgi:type II secretory pathway component PulM